MMGLRTLVLSMLIGLAGGLPTTTPIAQAQSNSGTPVLTPTQIDGLNRDLNRIPRSQFDPWELRLDREIQRLLRGPDAETEPLLKISPDLVIPREPGVIILEPEPTAPN